MRVADALDCLPVLAVDLREGTVILSSVLELSRVATSASECDWLEASRGLTVLEFGAGWCGYCVGAQPAIEHALAAHGDVRHIKVSDGRGKPLGRSFRVKLWPTLVVLRDGEEIARVVRELDRGGQPDPPLPSA